MIETRETVNSQYSTDFYRPRTAEAVEALDPDLQLVYNRRYGLFQVIRWVAIAVRYYMPTIGDLVCIERLAMWECDVEKHHQIEHEDSPRLLLLAMNAGDSHRKPEILDDTDRMKAFTEHRETIEEKIRGEWDHHRRFNRSQILKVWEPFYNWTGVVR